MDFVYYCSTDRLFSFHGEININNSRPLAQIAPFNSNLSLLSPPLIAPKYSGLSVNIRRRENLFSAPQEAWVFNSAETTFSPVSQGSNLLALNWVADSNAFAIRFSEPFYTMGSSIDRGTFIGLYTYCLLYTSPSPRDKRQSRMPSSA